MNEKTKRASPRPALIYALKLLADNFEDIKLFHVKLWVGINDDLLVDGSLEAGNEGIFLAEQKLGYLGVDPERQPGAVHIVNIA